MRQIQITQQQYLQLILLHQLYRIRVDTTLLLFGDLFSKIIVTQNVINIIPPNIRCKLRRYIAVAKLISNITNVMY